ncbi:MAG: ribonuclease E/G, partial [Alphaproteobacteria bacterium]
MSTRMLIDARHPEETRVAVIRGNRVEEFDYESVAKQQLKGNIYLAKVTRVEPSLQACFVEYGGNRHGFLAFSEIHPDYYQIPVADREALLAAEAEAAQAEAAEADVDAHEGETRPVKAADEDGEESEVEEVAGDEDTDEEASERRRLRSLRRRYKIQEVIKRRQILLVQVVKEERGSKGAALTTYLSLAGRYCVLMPNSFNGGGISRKIANQADRKKLKSVLSALDIPEGMGCIIRTAGLNRTKAEIKRDFDYLLRLWDEIRDRTLHSIAPALIHEEANLIRRSIRDLYSRDIDEVLVEGEEGYRTAKEFMKLLTPSHAKRVKHYKDRIPLFFRYQVESQLEAMYSPVVQLPSGGYLVIDPTEALVSIDVNSGRSTKEHNIEETALKTNLEAAEEIARQLRLRDLAGLIVIDFIDMEERGNNRKVEKRLKEALRHDRARIQMGRISTFGLLEMSRQRLRPNILEASMTPCPTCGGAGVVRSIESAALAVLRALEEEGIQGRSEALTVHAPGEVTSYILNQKRGILADFERQYDLRIAILPEEDLGTEPFRLEREARSEPRKPTIEAPEPAAAVEESEPAQADAAPDGEAEESAPRKRRRRRRRGRRGRGEDKVVATAESPDVAEAPGKDTSEESTVTEASAATNAQQADETGEAPACRPRRRRRKAAKESGEAAAAAADGAAAEPAETAVTADEAAAATAETADESAAAEEKPPRRRVRRKKSVAADTGSEEPQAATADDAESDSATPAAASPQPGTTK